MGQGDQRPLPRSWQCHPTGVFIGACCLLGSLSLRPEQLEMCRALQRGWGCLGLAAVIRRGKGRASLTAVSAQAASAWLGSRLCLSVFCDWAHFTGEKAKAQKAHSSIPAGSRWEPGLSAHPVSFYHLFQEKGSPHSCPLACVPSGPVHLTPAPL